MWAEEEEEEELQAETTPFSLHSVVHASIILPTESLFPVITADLPSMETSMEDQPHQEKELWIKYTQFKLTVCWNLKLKFHILFPEKNNYDDIKMHEVYKMLLYVYVLYVPISIDLTG